MLTLYRIIYVLASVTMLIPIYALNMVNKGIMSECLSQYNTITIVGFFLLFTIPFILTYVLLKDIDRLRR